MKTKDQKISELREALYSARFTLELLGNYGLPDENPSVCYRAMKDIAKEEETKAAKTLETTGPKS